MESTPLPVAAKSGRPEAPVAQRVVSLVSNAPVDRFTDIEGFLKAFNTPEARAEIAPFRFVIQRRARRNLGGKFSKGLTQEVTENIEVNPIEDLFGLRRWLGAIRQDPACVMLLGINKIKEDALAAPLVFSDILRSGRPILVAGADALMQDQLFSNIDVSFATVPPVVAANTLLRQSLVVRAQRKKGFVASVRVLLDLEGLPQPVMEKLHALNTGADPKPLTDAEVVNLCLLADLCTRYLPSIRQFKEAVRNSALQLPQLVSMFEILTADLPVEQAAEAFKSFLSEQAGDPRSIKNRGQLFGEVYRFLQESQGQGARVGTTQQKTDDFFRSLASVVILHRAQADPGLWRRCCFLGSRGATEQALLTRMQPCLGLLAQAVEQGPAAVTPAFRTRLGEAIFELVQLANADPAQVQSQQDLERSATAARLLPQFAVQHFPAASLVRIQDKNRENVLNKEKFLALFQKIPLPPAELSTLKTRLQRALNPDESAAVLVRKATLDVLLGHARTREKVLRDIYILSAVPELVNFSFHLGEAGLSPVERLVALSVAQNRLGLEMHPEAASPHSVGMFERAGEPALGALQNEPQLVSRAYTALVSLQVERLVRRAVDHKINYLQSNFGENFFEVIYQSVVERNDLPLSRHQLAWLVQHQNLLGNLTARGWKAEQEDELKDDFVHLEEARPPEAARPDFAGFGERMARLGRDFGQLLAELQASEKFDPRPENPHTLIWSLYRRGIYNLSRAEAREAFRGSVFYSYLKDLIAQISSENYSAFTREIQQEGVRIYVPRPFYFLLDVGSRFSFLIGETVVRYQILAAPVQDAEGLDPLSKVFCENLTARFTSAEPKADVAALKLLGEQIQRCNQLWWNYSRHVAFALVDRVLSSTIIATLQPGGVAPKHLWYLPDNHKLCLGPAVLTSDLVPFQKILQVPENMGSIQKNPRTASTTIDDFAIEAHKIRRLKAELENFSSVAEDVLDILQNLTHPKMDAPLVQRYEQGLEHLLKTLAAPLRHCTEREVQRLHKLATGLKESLQTFYKSPGSQREHLINMLQAQLRNRRSDGSQLRLNFTDAFILAKTEIKVLEKVKTESGETVSRQKKVEVEVDQSFQTLATRMREAIHLHELLRAKRYVVFSPEGQKKKQLDYVLEIIATLQDLRGNAITFYCDQGMLDEAQVRQLATRVKPHNFFKMDELRPEAPQGMTGAPVRDTLSGRLVSGAQAESAPDAVPLTGVDTGETVFTSSIHPDIQYRYDPATGQFSYLEPGASAAPARAFPVDLGHGAMARILMARLSSGKHVFHGLYGNEVLLPASLKPQPPVICVFQFPERSVRVVNEGGRPVVQVDIVRDEFLEELRSIN